MRFKKTPHKIWLAIFVLIYIFCLSGNSLVYGIKKSNMGNEKNLSEKQESSFDSNDLVNVLDSSLKKSSKSILEDISKDVSEKALNNIVGVIKDDVSEEKLKEYLICISDEIEEKKQSLEKLKRKIDICSNALRQERTFVTIKNIKNIVAVGDLHGDADSTVIYIKELKELLKNGELDYVIFLGDYIDRGPSSVKVLDQVITLKLIFPNKVTLLRGNHETKSIFEGFSTQDPNNANGEIDQKFYPLSERYISELKDSLVAWFDTFPFAADIEIDSPDSKSVKKVLAVHGGIPCGQYYNFSSNELIWGEFMNLKDTEQRCFVDGVNQSFTIGTQLLWNDFNCNEDLGENTFNLGRLCGRLISKLTLEIFCRTYGYDFIIRGHTFFGTESFHNLENRCYTIFSASNYCGCGNKGCVARLDYDGIEKSKPI